MGGDKYILFDLMIEGVQVINRDWKYLYVNESIARQGKYSREELIGRTMMEKYPGIELTEMFHHVQNCMTGGVPYNMVNDFEFPDGSRGYFELRIQPMPEGVLILSIDVTEQKLAEERLLQINTELENRVKERTAALLAMVEHEKELNELKSNFVSIASHQFRTPLSTLLSSLSLLEAYVKVGEQEKCARHIEKMRSSISALTDILNDFLSLEKLERGKMEVLEEEFELQAFAQNVADELGGICKSNQRIVYQHKGNNTVKLDKKFLYNVFFNLLSNAIKYSQLDIEFITGVEGSHVFIIVADKGIGIPEDEQENIFGKFYRAGNAASIHGTGLGLNIVKRYIDLMNGTIEFTSRENEGTIFTIHLPQQLINSPGISQPKQEKWPIL